MRMWLSVTDQVLWPALHYAIPDAPKTKSFYESESWAQYQAVNERFADAIAEVYEDGDISTHSTAGF
jgi:trehalose-6-phosphate synthase